jgi:hypothetical protein
MTNKVYLTPEKFIKTYLRIYKNKPKIKTGKKLF